MLSPLLQTLSDPLQPFVILGFIIVAALVLGYVAKLILHPETKKSYLLLGGASLPPFCIAGPRSLPETLHRHEVYGPAEEWGGEKPGIPVRPGGNSKDDRVHKHAGVITLPG